MLTDHRLANTDVDAIVCNAQDITRERVSGSEVRDAFGLRFESLEGTAFYTLDHKGYITRWNERAERLKGYKAGEILGEHISVVFTAEDRDAGVPEEPIETAATDGSGTVSGWRLWKDGSRFCADITIAANYDRTGTVRGSARSPRNRPRPSRPGSDIGRGAAEAQRGWLAPCRRSPAS